MVETNGSGKTHEAKAARALGKGCLQVNLIGFGVGGPLGVALVLTAAYLANQVPSNPGLEDLWPVGLVVLSPMFLLWFAAIAVWLVSRRRAKRLDLALAPWDREGSQYGPVIRGWHGHYEGRELDAWFVRGPKLELYLGCRTGTRGAVHRGGKLTRLLGKKLFSKAPMDDPPLDMKGVTFLADDPAWMSTMLRQTGVAESLEFLLEGTPRTSPAIVVRPGSVQYLRLFQPIAEIDEPSVRAWLKHLARIAQAVDDLGPSSQGVQETRLERWARLRRGRGLNGFLIAMGCIVTLFSVAMAAMLMYQWLGGG